VDEIHTEPICNSHVGLLLDDTGEVHLVVAPGARAPEGRFRITCRAGVPGLGVLRLEGRCGRPACPQQPAVAELLAGHAEGSVEIVEVPTVLTVELDAVTVLTPATDTCRAGVVPVDLAAWSTAAPDAWLLDGDAVRARLEDEYQDDLCRLVSSRVLAATDAVAVTDLGPWGLELASLSLAGVTTLTVGFGRPLDSPHDVPDAVRQLARTAWS
jgi:hypothetical protein